MKVVQFFNLIGIKLHMDFGRDIQILIGKYQVSKYTCEKYNSVLEIIDLEIFTKNEYKV